MDWLLNSNIQRNGTSLLAQGAKKGGCETRAARPCGGGGGGAGGGGGGGGAGGGGGGGSVWLV